MGPRPVLLMAVTVIGALNTSTSNPSHTDAATMTVLIGSDTTAYADRGDLRDPSRKVAIEDREEPTALGKHPVAIEKRPIESEARKAQPRTRLFQ